MPGPETVDDSPEWMVRIKEFVTSDETDGMAAIRQGFDAIGSTFNDVANLVAFIVSPRGRWLHGATVDLDGGEVKAF